MIASAQAPCETFRHRNARADPSRRSGTDGHAIRPFDASAFMRSLAVLVFPVLAGCGAILAPGPFEVIVDSQPPGASVLYEGRGVGVTPCTVAVSRSSREVELRRVGYHAQRVDVGTERNPWLAANVVTLGLGLFVDEALGTSVNPITQPLVVYLAPVDGPIRDPWRRELPPDKTCTPPPTATGMLIANVLGLFAHARGDTTFIDPAVR